MKTRRSLLAMLPVLLLVGGPILVAGRPAPPGFIAEMPVCKVMHISVDGESVVLATGSGAVRVTLCGLSRPMDRPEPFCRALWRDAPALTTLLGERVYVKADGLLRFDPRRVGAVHLYRMSDGLDVNQGLLRTGYGVASASCRLPSEERLRAEQAARAGHLGIWSSERLADYEREQASRRAAAEEARKAWEEVEAEWSKSPGAQQWRLVQRDREQKRRSDQERWEERREKEDRERDRAKGKREKKYKDGP